MASCTKITLTLENLLKCAACEETITHKNHVLSCYHSLCKTCTAKLALNKENPDEGGIRCPSCNALTVKGQSQDSVLMQEFLKMQSRLQSGTNKCQDCMDLQSNWNCTDCKMNLCDHCKTLHSRIPLCRGHTITKIAVKDKIVVDSLVFCKQHRDDPVQFNCTQCKQLICLKCKAGKEHESHPTETIEQSLEKHIPRVQANNNKLQKKISLCSQVLEAIQAKKVDAAKEFVKYEQLAKKHLDEVIAIAKNQYIEIMQTLHARKQEEKRKLQEIAGTVENKMKECKQVSNWVDASLQSAKGATLAAELQAGLSEKTFALATSRLDDNLHVQLPVLRPNKHMKEVNDMIGTLSSRHVSVFSTTLLEKKKQPRNFIELFEKGFVPTDVIIDLPGRAVRLAIVNNTLWVPINETNSIKVFNLITGKWLRDIENPEIKFPNSVKQAGNGEIILASDSGLLLISEDGHVITTILEGKFSDVSVSGDRLAAVCYNTRNIHICVCDRMEWKEECKINAIQQRRKTFGPDDTIVSDGNFTVVTQRNRDHRLWLFKQEHYFVNTTSCYTDPQLCCMDEHGTILVAFSGDKIFNYYNVNKGIFYDVNLQVIGAPVGAVFDVKDNLWVLYCDDSQEYKICKYSIKQKHRRRVAEN